MTVPTNGESMWVDPLTKQPEHRLHDGWYRVGSTLFCSKKDLMHRITKTEECPYQPGQIIDGERKPVSLYEYNTACPPTHWKLFAKGEGKGCAHFGETRELAIKAAIDSGGVQLYRITSVECKMVRDVTDEEIVSLGFRKPPVGQTPPKGPIRTANDFKVWWTATYPSHPFDKAWVWLISAKLVKEE